MGREAGAFLKGMGLSDGGGLAVNTGLGLGIVEGSALLKEILGNYAHLHFLNEDGSFNIKKTIVHYTSEVLTKYGLNNDNENICKVGDVTIYPADYFCPMDHTKGKLITITNRTHSIHLYDATWGDKRSLHHYLSVIKNWAMRTFGPERIQKLVNLTNKA